MFDGGGSNLLQIGGELHQFLLYKASKSMQKPLVLMLLTLFGAHWGFAKNQSQTLIEEVICGEMAIGVPKSA